MTANSSAGERLANHPDIFTLILHQCDKSTLSTLLRVDRQLFDEAGRILYHELDLDLNWGKGATYRTRSLSLGAGVAVEGTTSGYTGQTETKTALLGHVRRVLCSERLPCSNPAFAAVFNYLPKLDLLRFWAHPLPKRDSPSGSNTPHGKHCPLHQLSSRKVVIDILHNELQYVTGFANITTTAQEVTVVLDYSIDFVMIAFRHPQTLRSHLNDLMCLGRNTVVARWDPPVLPDLSNRSEEQIEEKIEHIMVPSTSFATTCIDLGIEVFYTAELNECSMEDPVFYSRVSLDLINGRVRKQLQRKHGRAFEAPRLIGSSADYLRLGRLDDFRRNEMNDIRARFHERLAWDRARAAAATDQGEDDFEDR
jgi:hypothetical protein